MDTTQTIVELVADIEQTDPLDLPPLYHTIDPEALNRCIESMGDSGAIKFEYIGYDVAVTNGDGVRVSEANESSAVPSSESERIEG